MQWPYGDNTLWHYINKALSTLHLDLINEQMQTLTAQKRVVSFPMRNACVKLYKKTLSSFPLPTSTTASHTCSCEPLGRAEIPDTVCIPCSALQSPQSQTILNLRSLIYTCKGCENPLKNLHNIHIELCSSCELIACKSCFNLLDDPAAKTSVPHVLTFSVPPKTNSLNSNKKIQTQNPILQSLPPKPHSSYIPYIYQEWILKFRSFWSLLAPGTSAGTGVHLDGSIPSQPYSLHPTILFLFAAAGSLILLLFGQAMEPLTLKSIFCCGSNCLEKIYYIYNTSDTN